MRKTPTNLSEVHIYRQDTRTYGDVTVTVVAAVVGGEYMEFSGTAKLHPDDRPDADTGRLVSIARAYESLANALNRRATGLVKHNDDMAAHNAWLRVNRRTVTRRRRAWERRMAKRAQEATSQVQEV